MPGVEARAGKFPGPSLIPALNAIQERLGWLPREELEALARDVRRPLYEIEGLISFYPHFRTTPPAKVALHVCHDLSCWLRGGEDRLAELQDRYGDDADVELVEVSCLGRCDIAPAAAVNERPVAAVRRGRSRRGRPGGRLCEELVATSRARALAQRPVPGRLRDRRRGTRCCGRCSPATLDARRGHRHPQGLRPARHGRRRLPDRAEVGPGRARPAASHQVRDLQRRRVRARHVQGPADPRRPAAPGARGPAARHGRGRRRGGLGLHPARVRPRGAPCSAPRSRPCARAGLIGPDACGSGRRLDARGLRLARRLHPRRGVRAARVHGGPPRRAAQQAAVPRQLRPAGPAHADQLGRDVRRRAGHPAARRRLVEGPGRSATRSAGSSSPSPATSSSPGVYCVPMGTTVRALLDLAGGVPGGAAARPRCSPAARPRTSSAPTSWTCGWTSARWPRPGTMLGSGALVVMAEGTDLLAAATNVLRFFRNESCGKCVPCRVGSTKAHALLRGRARLAGRAARTRERPDPPAGGDHAQDLDLRARPGRARARWCRVLGLDKGGAAARAQPRPEGQRSSRTGERPGVLHRPHRRRGPGRVPPRAPHRRSRRVPLAEALHRVPAAAVTAPAALPGFARSTVDGFAVRAADTYGASDGLPSYLDLVGAVRDGRRTGGRRPARAAASPMPDRGGAARRRRRGGDGRVHRRDDARHDRGDPAGRRRAAARPGRRGRRRRRRRSCPAAGRCAPPDLGLLAAAGVTAVAVHRRPRVAILSTGDEVVPAGHRRRSARARSATPPPRRWPAWSPTPAASPVLAGIVAGRAGRAGEDAAPALLDRRRPRGRVRRARRSAPGTRPPARSPRSATDLVPRARHQAGQADPAGRVRAASRSSGCRATRCPRWSCSGWSACRWSGRLAGCTAPPPEPSHPRPALARPGLGGRPARRRPGRGSRDGVGRAAVRPVGAAVGAHPRRRLRVVPGAGHRPRRRHRGRGDPVPMSASPRAPSSPTSRRPRPSPPGGRRARPRAARPGSGRRALPVAEAVGRVTAGAGVGRPLLAGVRLGRHGRHRGPRRRHRRRERDQPVVLPPPALRGRRHRRPAARTGTTRWSCASTCTTPPDGGRAARRRPAVPARPLDRRGRQRRRAAAARRATGCGPSTPPPAPPRAPPTLAVRRAPRVRDRADRRRDPADRRGARPGRDPRHQLADARRAGPRGRLRGRA